MRIKERLADGGAVLRSLTRRSRDQTGSIFDAEARRCGEKRGEAEGGKTRDSRVRRRAEGAESAENQDVRTARRMDRRYPGLSYCDLKAGSISTW